MIVRKPSGTKVTTLGLWEKLIGIGKTNKRFDVIIRITKIG